jgi:hypothetical protein
MIGKIYSLRKYHLCDIIKEIWYMKDVQQINKRRIDKKFIHSIRETQRKRLHRKLMD